MNTSPLITTLLSFLKQIGIALACFLFFLLLLNAPYAFKQTANTVEKITRSTQVETNDEPIALASNHLHIPSLDITAPVLQPSAENEDAYQQALKYGVVQHPNSNEIGTFGNTYIFGHSSDLVWNEGDYKTIFAFLPSIKVGESIFITNDTNTLFEYQVFETRVIKPTDFSVLEQPEDKFLLTLQTSYPFGTALRRFIVIAELIDKTPTTSKVEPLDESDGESEQ